MSAIAAIIHLDGRPKAGPRAAAMLEKLAHRGPDGSGLWSKDDVALGHRMLWTTPESLDERLPLEDPESETVVTCDARIDNREELLAVLGFGERPPAEVADSALVLAAYRRWGADFPARLHGDFVIVIWDGRRRSLLLARDPFGVKHVYYFHLPGRLFAAASEIKALHALPDVPHALDERAVVDHLLPLYDDKSLTPYKGILRLPANQMIEVGEHGLRLTTCWTPDLGRELRLGSDAAYAEAFRDAFTSAVRCRLRSAFPVGSMLSGGLDSSSVSCVAERLLTSSGRGPLITISSIWPSFAEIDPASDERRYVDAALATGRFDARFVRSDLISPLEDAGRMLWHQDLPLSAPNMYMDWAIFREAHELGARVILGGTDGDTVVTYGLGDLPELVRRGRLVRFVREVLAMTAGRPNRRRLIRKVLWRYTLDPLVSDRTRRLWDVARGRSAQAASGLPEYCRNRPINADLANRIGLEERVAALAGDAAGSSREAHWRDITSGMWSYLLESFEKAAGAFEIEPRYPFFDRRLVELCVALPPGQRLHNGWTRSIFRRAMEGILPPEIQWRRGKGRLNVGVATNLRERERSTLETALFEQSAAIEPFVDVEAARDAFRRYIASPHGSHDDVFTLLLVVNLWLWLRGVGSGLDRPADPRRTGAVAATVT
jgi:asparagine synthase (glutamine-hydrolysing)